MFIMRSHTSTVVVSSVALAVQAAQFTCITSHIYISTQYDCASIKKKNIEKWWKVDTQNKKIVNDAQDAKAKNRLTFAAGE